MNRPAVAVAVILGLAWIVCLALALTSAVDRDEHMYQAAGALLGEARLYDDFAFFQPPYAAWLHGGLQRLVPGPGVLLPARLAKALLAAALLGALYAVLRRLGAGAVAAALLVLLYVHCEVVRGGIGLARNHDAALLAVLGAVVLLPLGAAAPFRRRRLVAAGLLAGIAVGLKLTHVPLAVGVAAWPVVALGPGRPGWRAVGWIGAGGVLGLLPAALSLLGADLQAVRFNLLDYHLLNAAWHEQQGLGRGHDLAGKLRDAWLVLRRTDHAAVVVLAAVGAALACRRPPNDSSTGPRTDPRTGGLVAVLLLGALVMIAVPRPVQDGYYAPLLVVCVLAAGAAAGRLRGWRRRAWQASLGAACLAAVAHHGAASARLPGVLANPAAWPIVRLHEAAGELADLTAADPDRPIATTHPLYALEAGRALAREFAAAEFGWRLGGTLPRERARRFHVATRQSLAALGGATARWPVLVVADAPWDPALAAWAASTGRRPRRTAPGVMVWLPGIEPPADRRR